MAPLTIDIDQACLNYGGGARTARQRVGEAVRDVRESAKRREGRRGRSGAAAETTKRPAVFACWLGVAGETHMYPGVFDHAESVYHSSEPFWPTKYSAVLEHPKGTVAVPPLWYSGRRGYPPGRCGPAEDSTKRGVESDRFRLEICVRVWGEVRGRCPLVSTSVQLLLDAAAGGSFDWS